MTRFFLMETQEPNNPAQAQLSPALNLALPGARHIHLMGICGTGMASLAGILKQQGYQVTGSDQNVYPPISHLLEGLSIPVLEGYGPKNLHPAPDLVIVGNVITKLNPEAVELSRLRIPYLSMPQALRTFAMKGKRSIVICGTHGKTTTSALVAWVLERGGLDPSFMIGGIPLNFQENFKLGQGPYFVIEGDEYDTAFFDKGPKFLHYLPWITILTSIEFDHADIYRDLGHVLESFRRLIELIPPEGLLIANGDEPVVAAESKRAKCPLMTYGFGDRVNWRAIDVAYQKDETVLRVLNDEKEMRTFSTPLYGRHNISNLLSVLVLAEFLKMDRADVRSAFRSFLGVKRRQEIKGEKKGILVLDDFAHHPTAVRETIQGVKERFRGRRLVAVFEPRSNSSRRNVFQKTYATSFDQADVIIIREPPLMEKIPPAERFSSEELVKDLALRGLKAFYREDTNLLLDEIIRQGRAGDVILIMSNGAFDNLPARLLKRLEEM
jgi:UDP-N-acetylmuramate: L-alanyl-gamma-D-glutamyl-meso-diaminopimelate ligase